MQVKRDAKHDADTRQSTSRTSESFLFGNTTRHLSNYPMICHAKNINIASRLLSVFCIERVLVIFTDDSSFLVSITRVPNSQNAERIVLKCSSPARYNLPVCLPKRAHPLLSKFKLMHQDSTLAVPADKYTRKRRFCHEKPFFRQQYISTRTKTDQLQTET